MPRDPTDASRQKIYHDSSIFFTDDGPIVNAGPRAQAVTPAPAATSSSETAKESVGVASMDASRVTQPAPAAAVKPAAMGKQPIAMAGDIARGALQTAKRAYTGSTLESVVKYVDGELDQRGAKKAIKDTTGAVVEKLDQVTGKRLVELLEAKLRAQDEYNDILATRLAEALDRISKLEARIP